MRAKFLPYAFAVSLALNLFFTAAAGAIIHQLHRPALVQLETLLGRRLTASDRAILDENLQAGRPAYHAAQAPMIAAHLAVDAALRATPFDPAAFRAALDNWRLALGGFLESFETPLTNAAAAMSPAGRAALAAQGDAGAGRSRQMMNAP